jgi:hypothetical protein
VTITFTASGHVDISISGTLREILRYSAGCFGGDASPEQKCADLQQNSERSWQGAADAGTVPFSVALFDCSLDSAQACACSETMSYLNTTEKTGKYTTAGNQVTIGALSLSPLPDAGPSDAGSDDPADYCVSENTLTLAPTNSSATFRMAFTK